MPDSITLQGWPNSIRYGSPVLRITDAGVKRIGHFTRLRSLDLAGTRVTDAGLQNLERLTHLDGLSLSKDSRHGRRT